jgi:hypothetical protein
VTQNPLKAVCSGCRYWGEWELWRKKRCMDIYRCHKCGTCVSVKPKRTRFRPHPRRRH